MTKSAAVAIGFSVANAVFAIGRSCAEVPRRRFRFLAGGLSRVPRRYASLEKRLESLARPYMPALVEKRGRLLIRNAFGEKDCDPWARELARFMDETVLPRLGAHAPFAQRRLLYVAGLLDDMIAEAEAPRRAN
ncbi:MAG: hypothetical protein ACREFW_03060 [Rhizomicrobium sp.]